MRSLGQCNSIEFVIMLVMVTVASVVAADIEFAQFACVVTGALCYAGVQTFRITKRTALSKASGNHYPNLLRGYCQDGARSANKFAGELERDTKECLVISLGNHECRQKTVQPVAVPRFLTSDLETQVHELLEVITPSRAGHLMVEGLASAIRKTLHNFIPDAELMGFVSGDVMKGTAFAVAIPEVEVVLNVSPAVAIESLQRRTSRPSLDASKLDAMQLHKVILRRCTEDLTTVQSFKFRRSAFKGRDPKVTFTTLIDGTPVPFDLSVNAVVPLYSAALLAECAQLDPRAKDLILLVRRWAKYRSISHAAKGFLTPYAWGLLVIYFLQVRNAPGGPILPNLTSFKLSSSFLRKRYNEGHISYESPRRLTAQSVSVAQLFIDFLKFYSKRFDWSNEAVSVRSGQRAPPATTLSVLSVMLDGRHVGVAPCIEDPFSPKRNLGDCMTGHSFTRMQEEMSRADELLGQDTSFGEVMQPWAPPDGVLPGED